MSLLTRNNICLLNSKMKILKIYYGPGIVAACSQAATVDLTTP